MALRWGWWVQALDPLSYVICHRKLPPTVPALKMRSQPGQWRQKLCEEFRLHFGCDGLAHHLEDMKSRLCCFPVAFIFIFFGMKLTSASCSSVMLVTLPLRASMEICIIIIISSEGGQGCLMLTPCLESQGCHLIPLSCLLFCFLCLVLHFLSCHFSTNGPFSCLFFLLQKTQKYFCC